MLDISDHDGVAVLHMRRQGVNQLNVELLRRITAALEFVRLSRGVVLTGYRATFAVDADDDSADGLLVARRAALRAVRTHPCPVIAAINGDALGTGFELAAAARLRMMARGLIGPTASTALTAVDAAEAGLVESLAKPAGLLDEAIARARAVARVASA